eukprot:gb/GFBE01043732.1/.p1 GENE.gb/GFBE01043732.1/~~gb/GFBE01043732.1/.p1  ORF type:complete len:311 (+),score=71.80 gb/GFBE01043732.1/:1-933(+)
MPENAAEVADQTKTLGEPAAEKAAARVKAVASAGFMHVGKFEVRASQLPDPQAAGQWLDDEVSKLRARHGSSEQSAIRLFLGCNLDKNEALQRHAGIVAWRKENGVDEFREQLLEKLKESGRGPHPAFHEQVSKLVVVNPCALSSADGSPVSIYHVGTAKSSAAGMAVDEQLARWSISVAEYVDVWISQQSERSGRLAGHIQIFDLSNLGLWQASSGALVEKLKIMLSAGQHYMEAVSRIFVINSSSVFSMAWKIVKGLVSPRTASKISVSSKIPDELFALLGPDSAARLPELLMDPQWEAAVQVPPALA